MLEYYEMITKLRELIRHTDGPNSKIPAFKILDLAEEFQRRAEDIEMQMIVESQRNSLN